MTDLGLTVIGYGLQKETQSLKALQDLRSSAERKAMKARLYSCRLQEKLFLN